MSFARRLPSASSIVTVVAVCLGLALGRPAGAVEIRRAVQPVEGRYLVLVSPFTADVPAVARELAKKYEGRLLATWTRAAKGFWIELPAENAERLARDVRVVTMEEDALIHESGSGSRLTGPQAPATIPVLVASDALWHLTRISHRENKPTNADPESYYTYRWSNDGAGVTVYHIDTGVKADHVELQGRIRLVPQGKNAAKQPYDSNVIAADYVADDQSAPTAPCSGRPMSDASDFSAHGTATASLVVGQNLGVAGGAKLVPVSVVSCEDHDAHSSAAILLSALDWVADEVADHPQNKAVVTMSTFRFTDATGKDGCNATSCDGKSNLDILETAFDNLINLGVPVVASANNQRADACTQTPGRLSRRGGLLDPTRPGECPSPGCRSRVITVGATGFNDERWRTLNNADQGSNYGQCVDIWAPGQLVSVASGEGTTGYREAALATGTSYAAPIVAGVVARLLAEDATLSAVPRETADRVWERLAANATRLDPTASALGAGSPNLLVHLGSVTYTSQPQSRMIPPGGSATLSVAVLDQPVEHQDLQPGEPRFLYRWYKREGATSTPVTAADQSCPTLTVRNVPTTAACEVQITGTTDLWARVLRNRTSDYGDSIPARVEVSSCVPPVITEQPASIWWPEQKKSTDTVRRLKATVQSNTPYCYQWQRITPKFVLAANETPEAETFEVVESGSRSGDDTITYDEPAPASNPRRPNYYRLVLWPSGGAQCTQPATPCTAVSETAQIRTCTVPTADVFSNTEVAIDPGKGRDALNVKSGTPPITWLSCVGTCATDAAFTPVRTPLPESKWRLEHDTRFAPRSMGYYRVRRETSCGTAFSNAVHVTSVCDYQLGARIAAAGLVSDWYNQESVDTALERAIYPAGTRVRIVVNPRSATSTGADSPRSGARLPIYQWSGLGGADVATGDTADVVLAADRTITVTAVDPDLQTGCNRVLTFRFQVAACPTANPSFDLAAEHCTVHDSGEPFFTFVDGRVALNALPTDATGSKLDLSDFAFTWLLHRSDGATETQPGPALNAAVNRAVGVLLESVELSAVRRSDGHCRTVTIPVRLFTTYPACPGCAPQCKMRAVRSGSGSELPSVITIDSGEQLTLAPPEEQPGWTYAWHREMTASGDEEFSSSAHVTVAPVTNTRFHVMTSRSPAEVERSNDLQVLVRGAFDARAIPEIQTIEAESLATITVSNEGLPFTFDSTTAFAWRRGPDRDPNQPAIPGETGATLSVVSPADDVSFWCRIMHNGHVYDTNVATVIVTCTSQVTGTILTSPSSPYVGRGDLAYLSAVGFGKLLSYRWTYRTSQSAPAEDYSFGPAIRPSVYAPVTWFGVVAQDACGTTATFPEVPIYLCVPKITEPPEPAVVEPGRTAQLRVVARPAIDGQPLTFNWYRRSDNTAVTSLGHGTLITENGQPGSEFTTPPMAASDSFFATVTSICGGQDDTQPIEHRVFSMAADVDVCSYPAITGQSLTRDIVQGQTTTIVVVATGTDLTFQWYQGTTGDTSIPLAGGTQKSVPVAPSQTTSYWCRIKSRGVCTTYSPVTTVRVCTTPVVTVPPQSRSIFSGAAATLSVVTAPDGNSEPLRYQWQKLEPGGWGIIPGATAASYTTPPLTADATYRVEITAGVCPVMSDTATISICTYPEIVDASTPEVLIQPGASATLRNDISPVTDRTITWYRGVSGDPSTLVASGLNLSTYHTPPLTQTTQYWAQFTYGGCTSRTTTYTARVCMPKIDSQPAGSLINAGGTATSTIVMAPLVGQTFQWYAGTPGTTTSPVAGQTSATLTVTPSVTTTYWVRVTGTCGTSVDSAAVTVTICAPPSIAGQPSSSNIPANFSWSIGVTASGTNLTYQWYQGASGDTSTPLAGRTTSSLTVSITETTDYWVRVSGSCGTPANSNTAKISIPPAINTQPAGGGVVMPGTVRTLTVAATGTQIRYEWWKRVGSTDTVIAGATSPSYTTPITADVTYFCRVYSGSNFADSDPVVFTVCQPLALGWWSMQTQVAPGQYQVLSVTGVPAGEPASYAWYRGNAGDVSTPVGSQAGLGISPTVTTTYWVRVTMTDTGCRTDSTSVTINVCVPTITTQPAASTTIDKIANPNAFAHLTVAANVTPVTYQWYVGSPGNTTSPIAGATASSYDASPAADTTYWARVAGSCGVSANSTAATVIVCKPPQISAHPLSRMQAPNATTTLGVTASGTDLVYQWFAGVSGTTTTPIGTNAATVNVAPSVTTDYWVRVTGRCGVANSNTAKISVAPVITTQPAGGPITSGATRTLTVAASGTQLRYEWYRRSGGVDTMIVGATSASYTTTPITADTTFFARVYSGAALTDSAEATLTVCLPRTIGMTGWTSVSGSPVSLTVTDPSPNGDETYEWYSGATGNTSSLISTSNAIGVAPLETTQYWLRTKRAGCNADSAAVTVMVCIPKITTQPAGSMIASGTSKTLSVAATGTPVMSYQWYVGASGNTTSPIAGATASSYTTPNLIASTTYWVRIACPLQACGTNSVNSAAATVTVCQPPVITQQPLSRVVTSTQSTTLSVTATGDGRSYQWYQGTAGVTTTPVGTNSSTLTVQPGTTKSYWVRITGTCGVVDSAAAQVSVIPVITTQPAQPVLCGLGNSVTVSIAAWGSPLSYQWYRQYANQSPVAVGATPSLTVPIAQIPVYLYCTVTSGSASITSNVVEITSTSPQPTVYAITKGPAGPGRYWLQSNVHPDDRPLVLWKWYEGPAGNVAASTLLYDAGYNEFIYVTPASLPKTYWVRVLYQDTGCAADVGVTVP